MKRSLLCCLLSAFQLLVHGQSTHMTPPKPILDFAAIEHWERIGHTTGKEVGFSNDSRYVAYEIINRPYKSSTLIIQSMDSHQEQQFQDATPGGFTSDNKRYVFNIKDTLYIMDLTNWKLSVAYDIASWKQPLHNTRGWIGYLQRTSAKLVLRRLATGAEQHFDSVKDYSFDDTGQWLALQLNNPSSALRLVNLVNGKQLYYPFVKSYQIADKGAVLLLETGDSSGVQLQWIELATSAANTVYRNKAVEITNFAMDGSGKQLVIAVQEAGKPGAGSIWYYRKGMTKAIKKAYASSPGMPVGLQLQGAPVFSSDNKYIIFSLQNRPENRPLNPDAVKLDVWSYRDTILQATQLSHLSRGPDTYQAIIGVDAQEVIPLSSPYVKLKTLAGDYALVQKDVTGDRFWEPNYGKDSSWLLSLQNGATTYLGPGTSFFRFSPGGKYFLYFDDQVTGHYFSYELATGKLTDISSQAPVYLGDEDSCFTPARSLTNYRTGLAGWIAGDKEVLVYDNYDIWLLDLEGKQAPVNVTNGYGRSHHIKLRLTRGNNDEVLHPGADLLITALDMQTLYNGFFRKTLGKQGDPALLSMGPYMIDQNGNGLVPYNSNDFNLGMPPVKALQANVWVVKREGVNEAPNYYITKDFKTYNKLSDLHPQDSYHWLSNELIPFTQLDGKLSRGILYKPADFDPAKQYPVIFTYYEQLSHRMYQFPSPWFTVSGFIDIPWFVSRGYLVFTPDIHFTTGSESISAFNAVVGAAQQLAGLPYVDARRMGISGHSTSGGFTNYIITHTDLFAAVFEGAGTSDYISSALSLTGDPTDNVSRLNKWVEAGRGSIWQHLDKWLAQSPIMYADQVKSPLLIFHCKNDWGVPWAQAVEMFTGLRRLQKRVWMLQYDEGDHLLTKRNDARDLTIRVTQFFDHYLKGAPPPLWMTQGLPARLKGLEYRYELDPKGRCGEDCGVCQQKDYYATQFYPAPDH